MKRTFFISNIASALLIFLLLYTACSKILDYENFKDVLGKSSLLKTHVVLISVTVPVTEITISLLLMVPKFRSIGFLAAIMLLCAFSLYILYMIMYNPSLPCTCGGVVAKLSWSGHIILNIAFIVIAVTGLYTNRQLRKGHQRTPV